MTMEKKKVIITLCKVFPAAHSRSGKPTGFEEKLKNGSKIHTIRENKNGIWNKWCADINGGRKYLSVREWSGKPYNSQQRELMRFEDIGLQEVTMTYGCDDAVPQIWIDGKNVPIEEVAKNDGLTVNEFIEWCFSNNSENVLEGVVIQFTKFRY